MTRRSVVMATAMAAGAIAVLVIGAIVVALLAFPHRNAVDPALSSPSRAGSASDGAVPEYDYKDAPGHIGERATVRGTVVNVFTAKSGVTFLDFCRSASSCPFSAVIFASDAANFSDVKGYERAVKVTGVIKSYQSRAEMVISNPDQIE